MTRARSIDLVGVGLNATDTVLALDHFPERGSKIEYRNSRVLPGGQVATTIIACQQWGMTTRYVGKLGDDAAASLHQSEFARFGVDTRLIRVPGCASPQSLILVDGDGERTVLGRRDERVILQPEELEQKWITNARLLHVDGHDTAAATLAAQWARESAIPVVADLDEIYPGVEQLLHNVDYLIVSRDFPCRLVDEPDLGAALRRIHAKFNCKLTAATLGQDGVLAWDGRSLHYAAAYRVLVVDTTGAGDIFHAGFIYGLHRGWPLARQLDFACAAAALNCTAVGARGGIESVEAIMDVMTTADRYPAAYPVGSRFANAKMATDLRPVAASPSL